MQYSEQRAIRCPWSVDEFPLLHLHLLRRGVTGNPSRGSAETENTNKNEDDEESRSEPLQDVPEWLLDVNENLVDKNVQRHQYSPSSSHELPLEPGAKVIPGPGKHSIFSHFPKDRNCDICLRSKITRVFAEDVLVQSCPERNILVT